MKMNMEINTDKKSKKNDKKADCKTEFAQEYGIDVSKTGKKEKQTQRTEGKAKNK